MKKILFLFLSIIFHYGLLYSSSQVENRELLIYSEEMFNKLNSFCMKIFKYIIDNKLLSNIDSYSPEELQSLYGDVLTNIFSQDSIKNEIYPLCNELVQYEKVVDLCDRKEFLIIDMSRLNSIIDALFGFAFMVFSLFKSPLGFSKVDNINKEPEFQFWMKCLLFIFSSNRIFNFFIANERYVLFKNHKLIQEFQNQRLEEIYSLIYSGVLSAMMDFLEKRNLDNQQ